MRKTTQAIAANVLVIMLAALTIVGCGGGSGSPGERGTDVTSTVSSGRVIITGRIYAPSSITGAREGDREVEAASAIGKDKPVAGAQVTVTRMKSDGSLETIPETPTVATDKNGDYSLSNIPQEDNLIVVATKNVQENGADKTLSLKAIVSIEASDVTAGKKEGQDADAATTLAAEAMKDIVIKANTLNNGDQKVTGKDISKEEISSLSTEIQSALETTQGATSTIDLASVVTGGTAGVDVQLSNLENSPEGSTLKNKKDEISTKGGIRVHVVGIAGSGGPLTGATVIMSAAGTTYREDTDEKGDAYVGNFPIGSDVEIQVIKTGYEMVHTSQNIEVAARVNNVTVQMKQATTNQAPVANAGPDQTVMQGDVVTLSGAGSFDPDGSPITYQWTKTGGPAVTLSGADTATATFTTSESATYTFSLTVNDGVATSEPDIVIVVAQSIVCSTASACSDGNPLTLDTCTNPGTANATCIHTTIKCASNTECDDGNSLTIDSCTNAGTAEAACTHSQVSCVSNVDCNDGNPNTIDECANGGTLSSACTHSSVVPVLSATAAILVGGQAQTMLSCPVTGTATSLEARCSDSDTWAALAIGSAKTCTYTASGSYTLSCRLNSTITINSAAPFVVSAPANQPPSASALANPLSGNAPLYVQFTGGCTDSDGTCVSYSWNFGDGSSTNSQQNPNHTFTSAGTFTVTLTVTDDDGATTNAIVTITAPATGCPQNNEWITIPAGEFIMGYDQDDPNYSNLQYAPKAWGSPKHAVTTQSYLIQKCEVTNYQYRQCVNAGACTALWKNSSYSRTSYFTNTAYDNYPVVYMQESQTRAYCGWISGRMPSEAEWEKAARGPSPRVVLYPWGDSSPTCSITNGGGTTLDPSHCDGDTDPVGTHLQDTSYYGLLDMGGNVYELTEDDFHGDYTGAPSDGSAWINSPRDTRYRMARGGSWRYSDGDMKLSARNRAYISPSAGDFTTYYDTGFRCAKNAP